MSSSTASPTLSAAHLLAPITTDMEQVNRVIRQSLASDVLLINQIAEYIIGAGGKRLRPALLLLVAGAAEPEPTRSYQAALKAQQIEIQHQLDGGGPVHVSRPGLAALAVPIGDTNVVSFPRAPRPADIDGGGDAA